MNRVTFLIDGFNLYHSVKDAANQLGIRSLKWLDISELCSSYVFLFGKDAVIQDIYYFSALAKHLEQFDPGKVQRHEDYISCLKSTGIKVELAIFKRKNIQCPYCHRNIVRHEEKETDVALAVKLLELFKLDLCDVVVLVTGDTDIVPAIELAKKLYPDKMIGCAFPFKRKNDEISHIVHLQFKISAKQYLNNQFPDAVRLADGTNIRKPQQW
jgi:uncharacterized LabA/DUF88 family protein